MKRIRKISSVFVAVLMMAITVIPAFAAEQTGLGTITISNATIGKDYSIYKIFDANPSGTDGQVAYTTDESMKNAIENAQGGSGLFTFTKNTSGTYNVEAKASDEAIIAFLQKAVTTLGLTPVKTQQATSVTVEFKDIAYGYYLVTSSLGSVVTVDSTNKTVTVIDKNQQGPSWKDEGKTIVDSDVKNSKTVSTGFYGDTVKYKISVDTTNYDGAKKILEYYIKDTLGNGLSYQKDTVKVTVGSVDLTANEDYTITYLNSDQRFKITIPWYENNEFKYGSPSNITVTYSATIDKDAVIAGAGNKNTASFGYKDDSCDEIHESTEKTTTTYTFALAIKKVDVKGAALSGAHFKIGSLGGVKQADGTYTYTSNKQAEGYTTDFVSDDKGLIIVRGVAAGTYTATETKAPAGFNLLTDTVDITASVESKSTYTTTIITYLDKDGNVVESQVSEGSVKKTETCVPVSAVNIVNKAGTELPSTGGMGTTLFYIIGAVLVIGAGVLMITRKRMSMKK